MNDTAEKYAILRDGVETLEEEGKFDETAALEAAGIKDEGLFEKAPDGGDAFKNSDSVTKSIFRVLLLWSLFHVQYL